MLARRGLAGFSIYGSYQWLAEDGLEVCGPPTLQPGNGGSQCAVDPRPSTVAARASGRRLVLGLLEGDLEDASAELVAVVGGDRHQRFVVVGHRHESEAFALVRRRVAHHLHRLDGAERPKQLPEDVLLGLSGQVVDEQTPSGRAAARATAGAVTSNQPR